MTSTDRGAPPPGAEGAVAPSAEGAADPGAEGTAERGDSGRRPRSDRSFLAELPLLILVAFALALLLKTFVVQAFYIPSESMQPTLEVDDRVLVSKLTYRFRAPERGDIVVFADPDGIAAANGGGNPIGDFLRSLGSGLGMAQSGEKDFIKRIIGLPGETLEMRNGVIRIDGEPLAESLTRRGGYLKARDRNNFGPVTVPAGEYFVMGDNRRNSSDSRFGLGTIAREDVVGRAFVLIWPIGNWDDLPTVDYAAASG